MPSTDSTIAYVLKGFPRLSETFIANEIRLLEGMGIRLRLFSVKKGDEGKVHSIVSRIKAPVEYLPTLTSLSGTGLMRWLAQNLPRLSANHRLLLRQRPREYLRTLVGALRMSWTYRERGGVRPRKVFIKEFLQAGDIAARILADGSIRHVHGHFCHGATTITWFVSQLTGLSFSFTAHAKDIYVERLNPGDLLERKLNAARFVTTCTRANERHLQQKYPRANTVHTIYHGLDTRYFIPSGNARPTGEPPIILSVGRFVEKKGFEYLVEACARLHALGLPFRCHIVGEEGDQLPIIEERIEKLGIGGCVELRGAVTQEELRVMYQRASVFALPCQILEDGDRDGIPNVLAEAMASGLPSVTSAISGIPELIDHGVEGFLIPQRDSEALAGALRTLLEDPALRETMSRSARKRILSCFDSGETTIALRDLFSQTISAGSRAA